MPTDASDPGLDQCRDKQLPPSRWRARVASVRQLVFDAAHLFVLVLLPVGFLGSLIYAPILLLNQFWWLDSTLAGIAIAFGSWTIFGWWLRIDGETMLRLWAFLCETLEEKQRVARNEANRCRREIQSLQE